MKAVRAKKETRAKLNTSEPPLTNPSLMEADLKHSGPNYALDLCLSPPNSVNSSSSIFLNLPLTSQ
jgi:hypothetical protein